MKQQPVRLTVDMSAQEHMCLKIASATLGMSMKKFMLIAAFEKMKKIEDQWLLQKAKDILKKIKSEEDKIYDFDKVKKETS